MSLDPLKRVSVVILSYNRRVELERTLRELFGRGEIWREVIVCDNASTDGSRQMVREKFPQVKCINTGSNMGVLGWNPGYEAASGDWVLSLDDDSHPALDSFHSVCETIDRGCDAAAIALSIRRDWHPKDMPNGEAPAQGFSSAGVLLNRQAIADVGGYDPELFLFTNELHWSARALLAGWRLVKFDSACVIHRSAPLQRSSRRHAYYYCRNMLLFLLRYAPKSQLRPLLTAYTTNIYLYSILHRTTTYLRALRETSMLARNASRPAKRLTEDQFAQIEPDWRGPFAYLG